MSIFNEFFKKILGDKKTWHAMEARARALPQDYQVVYEGIKTYIFRFASGDGMDMIAILKDLLDLFEEGVANGQNALALTGDDVATFCDGLLQEAKTYTEDWRHQLNHGISQKLGQAKDTE